MKQSAFSTLSPYVKTADFSCLKNLEKQVAETLILTAKDGVALRGFFAYPQNQPVRGTVFILQGRGEFIEKYSEVFDHLLARGLAVATLDWRGQGGSARLLADAHIGHVETFDDYGLDFEALVMEAKKRALPQPFFMLAHSTGGAVALLSLEKKDLAQEFKKAVLTSPLLGLPGWAGRSSAASLAKGLCFLGLAGVAIPPRQGFSLERAEIQEKLTHDIKRHQRNLEYLRAEPRLMIDAPSFGWFRAAHDALCAIERQKSRLNLPILFLSAGGDQVVDPHAIRRFAQSSPLFCVHEIKTAYHEILQETTAIQAEFWRVFDEFID